MPLNLYDLPDPLPDDEEFTDLIPDRGVTCFPRSSASSPAAAPRPPASGTTRTATNGWC